MKVLWVKADKLLPVNNGGNIRSYHVLRHLASHSELTVFSYYGGSADAHYEQELQQQFPGAVALFTGKKEPLGWQRALDYLIQLPRHAPYAVGRFRAKRVQTHLHDWFQKHSFDIVVCDFLDAAVNFPDTLNLPCVLFQHNVESEIWRRHALTEAARLQRRIYGLEFRKMLGYERETVRKFDHVIAVSDHDRKLMRAWVDESRISVVPTGVDLQQFRPADPGRTQDGLVVFVGAMDWEPNIDAVEYFCSEVWPSVLTRVPHASFRIVGRNPAERVRKLTSSSVQVTGSVPSVVEHLMQAAVVIVPLRIGGGTRLKIYEAMAMGKALVSTSVGAEGLDVHHGTDIVLADETPAFAQAVCDLLQNRDLRLRYETAAAALAARYSWFEVGQKFIGVLQQVTREKNTAIAAEQLLTVASAGEAEC